MTNSQLNQAVGGGVEPPTVRLAAIQILGGQPQSTSRHYIVFIPESPPPRQEGMAASFIILQYSKKRCQNNRKGVPFLYIDLTKVRD